jgi:preprotein translocase subunit SecD
MSAFNNSQNPSASSKSAKTSGKPAKSIAILGLILIAFSAVAVIQDATKVKLGLDLRGGTSVTLTPRATEGANVTPEAISQAVEIIRQRVNSIGVAESEVAAQGSGNNRQIVISVPGETGEEIVQLVGQTAELRFRQVLVEAAPNATTLTGDAQNATLPNGVTPELSAKFAALDCTNKINLQGGSTESPDVAVVSCDRAGSAKYILAPAQVLGNMVSKATAAIDQQGAAGWFVSLDFRPNRNGPYISRMDDVRHHTSICLYRNCRPSDSFHYFWTSKKQ